MVRTVVILTDSVTFDIMYEIFGLREKKMRCVSVIIPAYNEEETIGQVINKVRDSKIKSEIIVVNNCSTDKTEELAKENGAKVIYCDQRGKGYAMEAGLEVASGDIILFIDGDLGIYVQDVVDLMVQPILEGKAKFTKSAFSREGGRVTELVAKPLIELLFDDVKSFEQPLSGIIAGEKEVFEKVKLEKDYGVDIGILLDMVNNHVPIEEVHIGRIDNNSQSWKSLSKMAKEVAKAIIKRADISKIKD